MADVIHDAVEAAWQDGFNAGQEKALDDWNEGYDEGWKDGYDQGYQDGQESP